MRKIKEIDDLLYAHFHSVIRDLFKEKVSGKYEDWDVYASERARVITERFVTRTTGEIDSIIRRYARQFINTVDRPDDYERRG